MIKTLSQIQKTKMNNAVFQSLKGCFNLMMLSVLTVFWCIPMYVLFFFKILSKHPLWRKKFNAWLVGTANNWIRTNNFLFALTLDVKWDLPHLDHLKLNDWYFIICNHQSWTDILILQKVFLNKIPFIRFFIKKELMWLPVLNVSWWAYDFPIMHRHSKEELKKHPELRKKDFLATQKACEIFQNYPVTILNFLEGTRFTENKKTLHHSSYENLLNPKTGGFAFAVTCMSGKIKHVLDVTIIYPQSKKSFWDFLCNRIERIIVKVTQREIPSALLLQKDMEDPEGREQFKQWITSLWKEKDQLISSLK